MSRAPPRSDAEIALSSYSFSAAPPPPPASSSAHEQRLIEAYSSTIFREWALADLSRWRTGQIGFRWRTRGEVVAGKGEACCGEVSCDGLVALHTYEVPFRQASGGADSYGDQASSSGGAAGGGSGVTLVKVRLCGKCSPRLVHHHGAAECAKAEAAAAASSRRDEGGESRRRRRRRHSRSRSRSRERSRRLPRDRDEGER